ncbi:MAG TPA: hypothetical protein VFH45_03660, partial [Acidimicrobiales bacterium]|nr:hypothetical protein [Acidimicrobiales bacterium]
ATRTARLVAAAGVGALALTLGACGSSGSSSSSGSTTTSTAGASSTTSTKAAAPDPAADKATAAKLNLTGADLPGWQSSPNNTSSSDKAGAAQLAACAGAPDPATIDVADVPSPNFDKGNTEISSDVTMVKTHQDGVADLQAIRGPKLVPCVQQVFGSQLKTQMPAGATASNLQVTPFTPTGAPADSFGMHLSTTVTVPNQGSVPVNIDVVGFLSGRAEVELDVVSTGGPVDTATESHLLSVLVSRAQQNAGS